MAKGKAKPAVAIPPKAIFQKSNIYTSSRGIDVPLKAVSQFKIDALRTSREIPEAPTYEAEVFGGEKETLELDAVAAENQDRMEEWKEYQKALLKERSEFGVRFNTLIVFEGVDLEPPGEDSDWEKSCKALGLKIPENPVDRKIFFINTEMLGTPEDMGGLVTAIFESSKFSPEVIQKMKATFRSAMEGKANPPLAPEEVGVANQ